MYTHLQPRVDCEAAHHGIHAGHVLTVADFLEHHFMSIVPRGQKIELQIQRRDDKPVSY